jgi:type I restriction enzyme, S subunit
MEEAANSLAPGDIVFARTGATTGKSFLLRTCPERAVFASYLIRVRPSDQIDATYLSRFFQSDNYWTQIRKSARGAAQPGVNSTVLKQLVVPFPPLDEQRRIAAILDHADDLRRKRREAAERLDQLYFSTFVDLFGDPISNPRNWPTNNRLGDVAEIVSGITKGRKLNGAKTRPVPYLAVSNVQDRVLALEVVKVIEATDNEIERYRLRKNDLVLTEGGDPDKLGRGTLWQGEIADCIHQNHIFRVRLNEAMVDPVFITWLVGGPRGKAYFLRSAKQTTGIASINMTQLREFPLMVPPLNLQREFAVRVAEIDKLKICHSIHLRKLDTLSASLQHRAFRGEL